MFSDPDIRAVIASIGGEHSCETLGLLDWYLIRRHPKIFMGYSDITVLNVAMHVSTGLVTLNGPAVVSEFGEFPEVFPYTVESVMRTLFNGHDTWAVRSSTEWTDEFLDWNERIDLTRHRIMQA